ncbi:MAG: IclR family transcriptional regulator [Microbacterium sp.]
MSTLVMDAVSVSGAAKGLVKGIALVDIVSNAGRPLRQSQVVEASGMPHATVVRMLDVLCELDLLRVDSDGAYGLGPRVVSWGQAFLNSFDLAGLASDLIDDLVARSGETCFLGLLDRDSVLYIAAKNSPHSVRPAANIGSHNPLYSTGIGKAILAFADEEDRTRLLAGPRVKKTANTIVEREPLIAELTRIRERGFSIDDVENEEGVRCVAAPVRDHRGAVIAALSVSAPAYRFSLDDVMGLAPFVQEAADTLSRRGGYTGPSLPRAAAIPGTASAG